MTNRFYNTTMKQSRYNLYFTHKGRNYIYNTLSCAIVSCRDELIQLLNNNELDKISNEEMSLLKKNNLIINGVFDELSAYKFYYNSVQYNQAPEELRLVILPTYQCNLRCTYCFEEDCKNTSDRLNTNKINQILEFLKSEIENPLRNYKKVALTLFGGEPFLCPNECHQLLEGVSRLSADYNLEMTSSAISNATLITEEIIDELIIPYNIRLQITLDGLKDQHDQKRKFANGKGSFEIINCAINNLNQKGCSSQIDLRLNIDNQNVDSIESVFKEYSDKTGYMYVGLLRPAGHNTCNSESCITDDDYLTKVRPKIIESIRKYKAATRYIPFGKQRPCALVRVGCFIIDPVLNVYKCDNLVGRPEYAIGKIVDGKLTKSVSFYSQGAWSPFDSEKCIKCKLLPACGKSCAYKCLLANGDMNEPTCAMTEQQLIARIKAYLDEQSV